MALGNNQVIKWDALKAAIDKMSGRLARKNGYYSTLTAGAAERLIVSGDVDSQFFSRKTGGIVDVALGEALIKKIRGNSQVYNQLIENGDFANGSSGWSVDYGGTITVTDGVAKCEGEDQVSLRRTLPSGTYKNGDILLLMFDYRTRYANWFGMRRSVFNAYNQNIWTQAGGNWCSIEEFGYATTSYNDIVITGETWDIGGYYMGYDIKNIRLYNLTKRFGTTALAAAALGVSNFDTESNRSTALTNFKKYYQNEKAYNAGSIVNFNGNTNCQIQSTDSNGQNASLCTLPAYTLRGIGTLKDEIEGNVLTRRIGTRAYQSGDENEPTYLTDKTNTLYPLATPTTETISDWDNSYDVYPNGTEALIPANGTTPHTTLFDGVIDYTIDAVEVLRNINEDFVSTKQSQGLTTAKQANARNNISVYSKSETDTALGAKEANANKVTSISSASTDTQYPSAKCVYDAIQSAIVTTINGNF